MSKFKNATKRIAAVAASAAVVSSSAFANLGSYPSNFVEDGEFNGKVVVGTGVGASDSNAAASVIDDLKSHFSGDSEQVQLTYKKTTTSDGSSSVDVIKSSKELNYGETLENVSEDINSDEVDILEDQTFENGASNEDYEQEIKLFNGEFNFGTRDEDGSDEAVSHIFYNSGDVILNYTMEFDSPVEIDSDNDENEDDFVGETLSIMGQDFIISEISDDNSGNITKIELLGGANKVALGEGETSTVDFEGKSYELEIIAVDGGAGSNDGEVVLSINGVTSTVGEFETKTVGGTTVAVTDVVGSDRDAVKGYAEVIFGGIEVTLEDAKEVQINEEDISDIDERYSVTTSITNNGFNVITLTYEAEDEIVLEEGESIVDPVFGAFELTFEGTNNPEYSIVEIMGGDNDDELTVTGTLEVSGENLEDFTLFRDEDDSEIYLVGNSEGDRYYFDGSANLTTNNPLGLNAVTNVITLNLTNDNSEGSGFFIYESDDEQYLYEIDSIDTTDSEIDFMELFQDVEDDEVKFTGAVNTLNTALEVKNIATLVSGTIATLDLDDAEFAAQLSFDNERVMDFSEIENKSNTGFYVTFSLDSDADGDSEPSDTDENFNVTIDMEAGNDNEDAEITVDTTDADFVNRNSVYSGLPDENADSDDVQWYVTSYGTMVEVDNEDNYWVRVHTPEEQVRAEMTLVFGGSSMSESGVVTVDADMVESKKEELEADGYEITGEEAVEAEDVEFDVTSPVNDTDAAGEDNLIVVGGPAVNAVARELLGIDSYSIDQAGVSEGEGVIKYFADRESVLVYGYSAADTAAAVEKLNAGGLSGEEVNV